MRLWISAALLLVSSLCSAQSSPGYLRFPGVHGDTVVFTAEGDVWRTTTAGGPAPRLGGEILVATYRASTLREPQLAIVSPATSAMRMVALADARDGVVVDPSTLVFTRYGLFGDNFRGYRGGLTATLWRYGLRGDAEAQPLTKATDGNSHDPMAWRDRIVFLSDRDGATAATWRSRCSRTSAPRRRGL